MEKTIKIDKSNPFGQIAHARAEVAKTGDKIIIIAANNDILAKIKKVDDWRDITITEEYLDILLADVRRKTAKIRALKEALNKGVKAE